MKSLVSVCLLFAISAGNGEESGERSESDRGYAKEVKILAKLYEDCSKSEWSSCLKIKLLSGMDRAVRSYRTIELYDGISFVSEGQAEDSGPAMTESSLEKLLPRSLEAREKSLNEMLMDRIVKFFSTYTLRVKLYDIQGVRNSISEARGDERGRRNSHKRQTQQPASKSYEKSKEETTQKIDIARGKGKKYGYFLFLPLMMAGTALPLALGGLALLAGKALIVSKLALLLSGIIGLKKLISSSHHHDHHSHGGYQRQFRSVNDIDADGQALAYSGCGQNQFVERFRGERAAFGSSR